MHNRARICHAMKSDGNDVLLPYMLQESKPVECYAKVYTQV